MKHFEYYDSPLVMFLAGTAAISITNQIEMDEVARAFRSHKLISILSQGGTRPENLAFVAWQTLAMINCRDDRPYNYGEPIFLEFQPEKGLTFDWGQKGVEDWFGAENVFKAEEFAKACDSIQ